jgi:hypothetical protein
MRKMILWIVMLLACFSANNAMANTLLNDSIKINHATDGNISEWVADKFQIDKETQISYAIDHDANNLYVAIKVGDQRTQMKMMMQGMSMFIDKKGKRKESTGIEFPVKRDMSSFQGGGGGDRPRGGQDAPNPKDMREKMAASMVFLKTFGFDNDDEKKVHFISDPNGINVAFNWDEANNFYLEYQLPISMIGSPASLNGKPLGIGWTIHGLESASGSPTVTSSSSQIVAVPAGSAPPSGRGGMTRPQATRSADFGSDSRFSDQSLWTKYVLTF